MKAFEQYDNVIDLDNDILDLCELSKSHLYGKSKNLLNSSKELLGEYRSKRINEKLKSIELESTNNSGKESNGIYYKELQHWRGIDDKCKMAISRFQEVLNNIDNKVKGEEPSVLAAAIIGNGAVDIRPRYIVPVKVENKNAKQEDKSQ